MFAAYFTSSYMLHTDTHDASCAIGLRRRPYKPAKPISIRDVCGKIVGKLTQCLHFILSM